MAYGFNKKDAGRISRAVRHTERSSSKPETGKRYPVGVGGGQRAFFQTIAGPDATEYPPSSDSPNVYYAQKVREVSFTETVGNQDLQFEAIPDSETFIFNLADEYISENSIVICFRQTGQWYTIDKVSDCKTPCALCEEFDDMPLEWLLSVSGITPGGISVSDKCPELNGDYVLRKNDGGWFRSTIYLNCIWSCSETIEGFCISNGGISEKWGLFNRGNTVWTLEASQWCNGIRYTIPDASFDCSGPNTFVSSNLVACNHPSSVTITPL